MARVEITFRDGIGSLTEIIIDRTGPNDAVVEAISLLLLSLGQAAQPLLVRIQKQVLRPDPDYA